jgi:hypothetical protein
MMSADGARAHASDWRWRPYHALALIPPIGMLGGLPFANRVHPLVLGMPFLFAWITAWVILTSLVMLCILRMDGAHGFDDDAARAADDAPVPRTTGETS